MLTIHQTKHLFSKDAVILRWQVKSNFNCNFKIAVKNAVSSRQKCKMPTAFLTAEKLKACNARGMTASPTAIRLYHNCRLLQSACS